jgi:hypothetical protein
MTQTQDPPNNSFDASLRGLILDSSPGLRERLDTDPSATLELISIAQSAHGTTQKVLADAVRAARDAEHSWSAIGEVLGMSKQAAQQRFGGAGVTGNADHENPLRQNLYGLSAFNEMARLNDAGRYGWHSVGFGAMFHTVEKSDVQWEHLRLTLGITTPDDSWIRIGGSWFPWVYYARPTARPALPEPGR